MFTSPSAKPPASWSYQFLLIPWLFQSCMEQELVGASTKIFFEKDFQAILVDPGLLCHFGERMMYEDIFKDHVLWYRGYQK